MLVLVVFLLFTFVWYPLDAYHFPVKKKFFVPLLSRFQRLGRTSAWDKGNYLVLLVHCSEDQRFLFLMKQQQLWMLELMLLSRKPLEKSSNLARCSSLPIAWIPSLIVTESFSLMLVRYVHKPITWYRSLVCLSWKFCERNLWNMKTKTYMLILLIGNLESSKLQYTQ